MAAMRRIRSGFAMPFNSLAALPLIRIEKFTPNLFPVENRITGVSKPLNRHKEVVEIF